MKKLFSIFFIILFFSCSKKKENDLPRLIVPEQENIVEVNSKEMLNVYTFFPLAFNFTKEKKVEKFENRFDSVKLRKIPFDTLMPKFNLRIIIDTSNVISDSWFEYKFLPRPTNVIQDGLINGKIPTDSDYNKSMVIINEYIKQKSKLTSDKVKCYPLYIFNNSNNDVFINSEFIQEAKDIDGKWKPIEFTFEYEMCGTGKGHQSILNPEKYAVFAIIKYKGDFKTKIRIKLKNNKHIYYSNEIEGNINRSQFNQDFCKSFLESYGSNVNMENFDYYKKSMFLN
jgi:hypothetical protein